MQPLPSLGWVRAAQFVVVILAIPALVGQASAHLLPAADPDIALILSLFPCFCLWMRLEEGRSP